MSSASDQDIGGAAVTLLSIGWLGLAALMDPAMPSRNRTEIENSLEFDDVVSEAPIANQQVTGGVIDDRAIGHLTPMVPGSRVLRDFFLRERQGQPGPAGEALPHRPILRRIHHPHRH